MTVIAVRLLPLSSLLMLLIACPPTPPTGEHKDAGELDVTRADASARDDRGAVRDAAPGADLSVDDDARGSDAAGPCTQASQCAPGLGCRTASGECNTCRIAQECRPGEACLSGVCGACTSSVQCNGGLCDNGTCRACTSPDDSALCASEYQDPDYACGADGQCRPPSCTAGMDCWRIGQVCSSQGRCEACATTSDCLATGGSGNYPARTTCIEGVCVEGDCLDSNECPADRPICASNYRCRGCQLTQECLNREGAAVGYVCDPVNGRCEAGDCYPAGQPCDSPSGGVCDNFTCRTCSNPVGTSLDDCQSNGYASGVLCVGSRCVTAECNAVKPCALGRVCEGGSCVDCTAGDDSYCTGQGMTCNTVSQSCVGCTGDAQCAGGQRICDNNECRDCLAGECGTGRVCAGGACVSGACWIDGLVYDSGDTKAGDICSTCNPVVSPFAWSPNPGTSCNDGDACSSNDTCSASIAGACGGAPYTCSGNACADGVCHGAGSTDCTLAKKSSWSGCFVDGNCYAHGDKNPGNACQYCDGASNAWADIAVGTDCGDCRSCQASGGGVTCALVPDGQDPHNDCAASCQVCDGVGGCRWADTGSDVNNDCAATAALSCGLNGECVGGNDQCAFWSSTTVVNDNNECTVNDRCDGAGGMTGDPLGVSTTCANDTKVCRNGVCSDCQAGECGGGRVCAAGTCVVGNCNTPGDCGTPAPCKKWTCPSNSCVEANDDSANCDDRDPCTVGDRCLGGICQAGPGSPDCSAQDDACNVGVCSAVDASTYVCQKSPKPAQTSCDEDGLACTVDACTGPDSAPRSCTLASYQAGTCYIGGICYNNGSSSPNGCGLCDSSTPTAWQPETPNTPCGTSACEEVCSGTSCVERFYVSAMACRGVSGCTTDRLTGRVWIYELSGGCPSYKTWSEAVSICLADNARLPTRAEMIDLVPAAGCKTTDCVGNSVNLPGAFAGKVQAHSYWTSDDLDGDGSKNVIEFKATSYAEWDVDPANTFGFFCVFP